MGCLFSVGVGLWGRSGEGFQCVVTLDVRSSAFVLRHVIESLEFFTAYSPVVKRQDQLDS
jgi:hypothetical protein